MKLIIIMVGISILLSTVAIAPSTRPFNVELITSKSQYEQLPYYDLIPSSELVTYSRDVLTTGHIPLILTFPIDITLSSTNLMNFISKTESKSNQNITYEFYILEKETYLKDEIVTQKVGGFVHENGSTTSYFYETYDVKQNQSIRYVWKPIKSLSSLQINKQVVIDIVGHVKASTNKWSVDVIPEISYNNIKYSLSEYAWWDSDWNYYTQFYVDASYVQSNLHNFPLCVNISNATILANAQADGDDIRFVSADNTTTYYYECEYYSPSRYAIFWVNISTISSVTDTYVNVYYGNPAASNAEDRVNTWHSRYRAVYHMNQTAAPVVDSTSNNYNSTSTNNNPGYYREGNTWKSIEYSHTSDAHVIPKIMTNAEVETSGFTYLCWFKVGNLTADRVTLGLYNDLKSQIYVRNSGGFKYSIYIETDPGANIWADSSRIVSANQWYFGAAVFDKPATTSKIYVDGKLEGSNPNAVSIETATYTNTLANTRTFGWGLNGNLDEARIYLGVLNASYINATYRNTNATTKLIVWKGYHLKPDIPKPEIFSPYPLNNSKYNCFDIFMSINTNTTQKKINVTFYVACDSTYNNTNTLTPVAYFVNVTPGNHTFYFRDAIFFNETIYWNVSVNDGAETNSSPLYSYITFTTKQSFLSNCKSSSGCGSSGIVGIFGILGFLGFIAYLRRRKK